MADMAMLAKLAMLAALPLTQDGQLGLLKGRMPPFCRRGVSQYLGKNAKAAKTAMYANSAITGLGGNVGERSRFLTAGFTLLRDVGNIAVLGTVCFACRKTERNAK
jgi:hypothetical protein